jgi:hypothetical protein
VIREPAEAAENDVFIAGQSFARAQRGVPFSPQNRDIAEHLSIELIGQLPSCFPGGNHGIPRNASTNPHRIQFGQA